MVQRLRLPARLLDDDLRRALRGLAPYRRRLAGVLALSLISTLSAVYLPYLSRELIDRALVGRDAAALVWVVALFVAITLAGFALNVASGMRYTRLSAEILFDMRLDLYRHLQRLSPRFYARTRLGDIVSRINNDVAEIQRIAAETALAWVGNVLFLAGTIAMLAWLDVRLFVLTVATTPFGIWALVRYRTRLEIENGKLRQRSADIGSFLIVTLQSVKLVVTSNAQEREVGRFRERNAAIIDALMSMQLLSYLSGGLPGLVLSAGTGAVFVYGGLRVIKDRKSTRLNSSHHTISYAVFCLKKKRHLTVKHTIEAKGLVVAPGFIDLHEHGQEPRNYEFQAHDGVTTSLELEAGNADVDQWYARREGSSLINFGVSIGHIPVRMKVMNDPGTFLPVGDAAHREATAGQLQQIDDEIEKGLRRGALAVGMGINYTAAATHDEIVDVFRLAAKHGAPVHVHLRHAGLQEPTTGLVGIEEVIAAAAATGAPLHVVHITSMGLKNTPRLIAMVKGARDRGLDVTTECYPYTAGSTQLESAIFDPGWQDRQGITFKDIQWTKTGERLTAESFEKYRKEGGTVVIFSIPEEAARAAVADPLVMIEIGRAHV